MNKNKIEKLIGIKNFILDKVEQKTKIIDDMEDLGIVCEVRDADVYAKGLINSDRVKYVENKQKAGDIIIDIVTRIQVGLVVRFHKSSMKEGRIFLQLSKFFYTKSSIGHKKGIYFKVSKDKLKDFNKNWQENALYYKDLTESQQWLLNEHLVNTYHRHYSLVLDVVDKGKSLQEIVTLGLSTWQSQVPYTLYSAREKEVKEIYIIYKQPDFLENKQAVSTVVNKMVLNKGIIEDCIEHGTITAKGGQGLSELSEMMADGSNFLEINNNVYIAQGMFSEVQNGVKLFDKWKVD